MSTLNLEFQLCNCYPSQDNADGMFYILINITNSMCFLQSRESRKSGATFSINRGIILACWILVSSSKSRSRRACDCYLDEICGKVTLDRNINAGLEFARPLHGEKKLGKMPRVVGFSWNPGAAVPFAFLFFIVSLACLPQAEGKKNFATRDRCSG